MPNTLTDFIALAVAVGLLFVALKLLRGAERRLSAARDYWERAAGALDNAKALNAQTADWLKGSETR